MSRNDHFLTPFGTRFCLESKGKHDFYPQVQNSQESSLLALFSSLFVTFAGFPYLAGLNLTLLPALTPAGLVNPGQ